MSWYTCRGQSLIPSWGGHTHHNIVFSQMTLEQVLQPVKERLEHGIPVLQPVEMLPAAETINLGGSRGLPTIGAAPEGLDSRRRDLGKVQTDKVLEMLANSQAHAHVKAVRDIIQGLSLRNKLLHSILVFGRQRL
jgi:hypothetical protein